MWYWLWDSLYPTKRLWVDPRMALESFEVNLWEVPENVEQIAEEHRKFSDGYGGALSDGDALDLPCGAKAVAYTGSFAAAVVAAQIRRWLCGFKVPFCIMGDAGVGRVEPQWLPNQKFIPDALVSGEESLGGELACQYPGDA